MQTFKAMLPMNAYYIAKVRKKIYTPLSGHIKILSQMQMLVYNLLVQDTYLMIGMNESQTLQRFCLTEISREIQVYGVEHLVVGYATYNFIPTSPVSLAGLPNRP